MTGRLGLRGFGKLMGEQIINLPGGYQPGKKHGLLRNTYKVGSIPILGTAVGAVRIALATLVLAISTVTIVIFSALSLIPRLRNRPSERRLPRVPRLAVISAGLFGQARDQIVNGIIELVPFVGFGYHKLQERDGWLGKACTPCSKKG